MKIITDSREQRNSLILQDFNNNEIPFKVKKLDFGDYSIEGHENNIAIERKQNLTELAGNFCSGRKRFENEFIRAMEAGAKIVLLIEDKDGREKLLYRRELDKNKELTNEQRWNKTWRSNFCANSMIASLASWKDKYNLDIIFCDKKKTGSVIIEIFENYLKSKEVEHIDGRTKAND